MYNDLYNLYYSLNPDFLDDLENHAIESSDNKFTLQQLISKYASLHNNDTALLNYIHELNENNSISCMVDYYELIDDMIFEVE